MGIDVGRSGLIASHSGLRGRPGAGLTPAAVRNATAAFVEYLRAGELPATLGVARDGRPSGATLTREVIAAGSESGADVVDFGVVSTPAVKLAARSRALGGAMVVTGSHLGSDWNGVKLVVGPDYKPVDVRELPVPPPRRGESAAGSVRVDEGAAQEHAVAVCASVDVEAVRGARLQVSACGGAGRAADLVLDRLGCRTSNGERDAGLRLDADGDRLQLEDEHGELLEEEVGLPLAALGCGAATIVKGADTSRMIDVLVAERGGSVRVVPPGELHLVEALATSGADLAGEGNGGVVVPSVGMSRDGLAAAAAILELLARTGEPLSRLAAALPRFARRRSTLPCAGAEAARPALDDLAGRLDAEPGEPEAGVRIERPGGAWALVRQSATEPVLRVTVEAVSEPDARELHAEIRAALRAPG